MPRYQVIFKNREAAGPGAVSFSASDPGQALAIAQRCSGAAEIWQDEAFLCSVEQTCPDEGFWIISPKHKFDNAESQGEDPSEPDLAGAATAG